MDPKTADYHHAELREACQELVEFIHGKTLEEIVLDKIEFVSRLEAGRSSPSPV